jgi:hypothetical protein
MIVFALEIMTYLKFSSIYVIISGDYMERTKFTILQHKYYYFLLFPKAL